ncbi:MAG: hypothetical protein ACLFVP_06275 [Candidatus Bathyarchaeia archaeon]
MSRPGRDLEKEMKIVRVCVIKPDEITGRMMVRIDRDSIREAYTRE